MPSQVTRLDSDSSSKFDFRRLRRLRKSKGVSAVELAQRLGTSPSQIHRLEKGLRRLTVDVLLHYCEALGESAASLLAANVVVPITGVINSEFEVEPLTAGVSNQTLAPPLIDDMSSVAGLRWAAIRRYRPMLEHVVFYKKVGEGVPDYAWNKRCLLTRKDGSQCLGWPTKDKGSVHVDVGDGLAEFSVELAAASPVIAVIPPFVLDGLRQSESSTA